MKNFLRSLLRTKPVEENLEKDTGLKRVLGAWDLTLLGIGAIIGAGIFVLTGVAAAEYAGPAVILSFVVAGLIVACAALAYAELASSIGGCGSAYGYGYAGLGEFVAWVIGWLLILEYSVAIAAVSVGWSGYVTTGLAAMGLDLPVSLTSTSATPGGFINLPAALIIITLGLLIAAGAKISSLVNAVMVFIKVSAILLFIAVAVFHVEPANWIPFIPEAVYDAGADRFKYGWQGILSGAAIVFFAYIGFDAVSTAAEETRNPRRDLPIGILGSLVVCTLLYMLVSGLLTGVMPYRELNTPSPVADALLAVGVNWASGLISVGAVAGLFTVMLVLYFALTRILLAISRDQLLPGWLAHLSPHTKTPTRVIMITGLIMATMGGFMPLGSIVELTNIGTLGAFTVVCAGVAVLRVTRPDLKRSFKTPFSPLIPILGVLGCIMLMLNLQDQTWRYFSVWMAIGLVIYFVYSYRRSALHQPVAEMAK